MTQFFLRKFLFRPVPLTPDTAFQFDAQFEELWFDTPDGERLNALFFPAPAQPARGAVLYFHGNRDNLQRWGAMHRDFTALGYDFLVPDYRGYGKSSGEPEEEGFYADSMLVFKWLTQYCSPERIVLYGRSLGSGVACWLAAQVPARLLLLETPFDSVAGLVAAHLRRERLSFEPELRFPNDEHLRQTTMPVLIFHGTRDGVVPYASAANLKSALKPGDVFVTIEGGSHNNLGTFEQYREGLRQWLG